MYCKALLLLLTYGFILTGCASSNVSRDVSSGVDMGVQNAKNLYDGATGGDLTDSYQNTSQATKGALLGGVAGAATGLMSSSVGFLPGTAVGAILGASYGAYIDSNANIEDKLINRGVNVVVLGDQVLIVVPSARLFNPMTSKINFSAYSTLDLVICYINCYTKMLVKIAAFTNDMGSCCINRALSDQQARAVAKYFTDNGIDARLLYASGYGGSHLVDSNSKGWDSDNYRIEITLEKLHV